MEYELIPEPPEPVRAALDAALREELLAGEAHPAYGSAWRRAGIEESLGLGDGALAE